MISSEPTSRFDQPSVQFPGIPNAVLHDTQNRRLRVITIGAGVQGILNAYNFQEYLQNVEHVIYDKNADIGGTWFENRYPGCACDVPSHLYTFHFAPNPEWSKFLSSRESIWAYLDRVCRVFDLRKNMNFSSKITQAVWNEDKARWDIKGEKTLGDGTTQEFMDYCDVLLYCTGILNNWKLPDIEGMDTFRGRIIHTATWPESYGPEQWKNQKVAVIGSGASSLQVVPNMQPEVEHMDVFVRTGVWFAPLTHGFSETYEYTQEEIQGFRTDPQKIVDHMKLLETQLNRAWPSLYKNSPYQAKARAAIEARMAELIKDPALLQGYIPNFSVGCRRITPGEPYLRAIQRENVKVHFTPVVAITPEGVIGGDGALRKVDTIVCATGFDVSFRPRFPIIGRDGVDLAAKWKVDPESYFGLTVPGLPNFIIQGGPPSPVQNGTPFGTFQASANYSLEVIRKLQQENIRSIEPKLDVTRQFNVHTQMFHQGTSFSDNCRSWYKNNETGRVNAVWPGSALHYIELVRKPRWEDYNIDYRGENMFSFMGVGLTAVEVDEKADVCSYLRVSNIHPLWLKEMSLSKPQGS